MLTNIQAEKRPLIIMADINADILHPDRKSILLEALAPYNIKRLQLAET